MTQPWPRAAALVPSSRRWPALVLTMLATVSLGACGGSPSSSGTGATTSAAARSSEDAVGGARKLLADQLGAGFLAFPDAATQWVQTHPDDARATAIKAAYVGQPTALWLTGDESFGNLEAAVESARTTDRTMVLSLYNAPLRWDGLSEPSRVTLAQYRRWIDRVVDGIGDTRAVVVLEPDALWFQDRLPTEDDRRERLEALRYAVEKFAGSADRTRLYLDAGTSSGSVSPERMATLLVDAGVQQAAGFAVNTSSYSPTETIEPYAQAVRAALQQLGVDDPRYIVDTGRNGASGWDYNWCNPPDQRLGARPQVIGAPDGLDMNLWIKAPGTSDGDCGPTGGGRGTEGGEFIADLAYRMID